MRKKNVKLVRGAGHNRRKPRVFPPPKSRRYDSGKTIGDKR